MKNGVVRRAEMTYVVCGLFFLMLLVVSINYSFALLCGSILGLIEFVTVGGAGFGDWIMGIFAVTLFLGLPFLPGLTAWDGLKRAERKWVKVALTSIMVASGVCLSLLLLGVLLVFVFGVDLSGLMYFPE
jgi:hypothetical protein